MSIKSNFDFPQLYIEMDRGGHLDSKNFIDMHHLESKEYIWFYDMEWITIENIKNYQRPDYQSENILVFAKTGGGDLWAWNLDYLPILPVVFCPHDDDEGKFYANSLETALFRHILEFASQNNFCIKEGNPWEFTIDDARKLISVWEKFFMKWFNEDWINEINKLTNLELKFYKPSKSDGYYVLITPEEADLLIEKYITFNLFEQPFVWTV